MTLPLIVQWGDRHVGDYTPAEYGEALHRAFVEDRLEFITLDDNPRFQKFRAACVAWAITLEILYHDHSVSDGQSEVSSFRLTPAGRVWLGLETITTNGEINDEAGF